MARRTIAGDGPDPIDVHVGSRSRRRSTHRPRLRHIVAQAAMFATIACASGGMAEPAKYPPIFGSREVRIAIPARFAKWTAMLERHVAETERGGTCAKTGIGSCRLGDWTSLLEALRGSDPTTQLDRINRFINEAPYVSDRSNYDVPDYWATPRKFLERAGDCEDFAIAKFMSLRALGWRNGDLRLVVLEDLNLGTVHAVVIAYRDGVAWVLDNQIERVVAADRIRHYRPYYSLNEDAGWLHWQQPLAPAPVLVEENRVVVAAAAHQGDPRPALAPGTGGRHGALAAGPLKARLPRAERVPE